MRVHPIVTAAAAAAVCLSLTACGMDRTGSAPAATAPTGAMTADPVARFGPGCAAVPTDPANPGSFPAMSRVPVATAASGNPLLSTLVTAVKQAGLVDTLNAAPAVTVLAPTNDAFGKIPKATLDKVLANRAMLTSVLTYHVLPGKLTPESLAGSHKSMQGKEVTVTGGGTDFTINGTAGVVCGNVQTANATVYLIDTVLMPPS
ncbi:lipoprotein [Pilimelia anulata]|uniref:Lipoprotein n=1 Tax=Pilimelia anulata TaxID=53371 RepID=A0A8J3BGS8_9ACTN|nr:fasciclin domain-containing protein [Pilimelia anulata]GGK09933.1 lipoprotein [Pilimelia anulata]